MKEMQIGIVAEGITDQHLLNELICDRLQKNDNCLFLQPPYYMDRESGWAGVMQFCIENIAQTGYDEFMRMGQQLHAVIIALDGDTTREGALHCSCRRNENCANSDLSILACYGERISHKPYARCNYPKREMRKNKSIEERVAFLRNCILRWCNIQEDECRESLLIVVPCDAIEAWIIAGQGIREIESTPVEEFHEPFRKHVLLQDIFQGWQVNERKRDFFNAFTSATLRNWDKVKETCMQAKAFDDQLESLIKLCR